MPASSAALLEDVTVTVARGHRATPFARPEADAAEASLREAIPAWLRYCLTATALLSTRPWASRSVWWCVGLLYVAGNWLLLVQALHDDSRASDKHWLHDPVGLVCSGLESIPWFAVVLAARHQGGSLMAKRTQPSVTTDVLMTSHARAGHRRRKLCFVTAVCWSTADVADALWHLVTDLTDRPTFKAFNTFSVVTTVVLDVAMLAVLFDVLMTCASLSDVCQATAAEWTALLRLPLPREQRRPSQRASDAPPLTDNAPRGSETHSAVSRLVVLANAYSEASATHGAVIDWFLVRSLVATASSLAQLLLVDYRYVSTAFILQNAEFQVGLTCQTLAFLLVVTGANDSAAVLESAVNTLTFGNPQAASDDVESARCPGGAAASAGEPTSPPQYPCVVNAAQRQLLLTHLRATKARISLRVWGVVVTDGTAVKVGLSLLTALAASATKQVLSRVWH